jgi:hypothetical protein
MHIHPNILFVIHGGCSFFLGFELPLKPTTEGAPSYNASKVIFETSDPYRPRVLPGFELLRKLNFWIATTHRNTARSGNKTSRSQQLNSLEYCDSAQISARVLRSRIVGFVGARRIRQLHV